MGSALFFFQCQSDDPNNLGLVILSREHNHIDLSRNWKLGNGAINFCLSKHSLKSKLCDLIWIVDLFASFWKFGDVNVLLQSTSALPVRALKFIFPTEKNTIVVQIFSLCTCLFLVLAKKWFLLRCLSEVVQFPLTFLRGEQPWLFSEVHSEQHSFLHRIP